jgi:hypothetical protein
LVVGDQAVPDSLDGGGWSMSCGGALWVLHQLQPPTASTGTTNIADAYQCIMQASTVIVV